MKNDIFETAKTKVKNTTTFEINDTGRDCEYSGHGYVKPFISFLESLNLEPTQTYEHSNNVIIAGVEFAINTDHASFMSKNAYTRDRYERKPQNRYVSLDWSGKTTVRVYINKEMDADKIKAQIKKSVQGSADRDKEIEDRKKQERDNTVAIGKHYTKGNWIRKHFRMIHIERGVLHFHMDKVTIYLNAEGTFNRVSVYVSDVTDPKLLRQMASDLSHEVTLIPDLTKMLLAVEPLPADLIEWSKKAYHAQFDVKKQSLKK